MNYYKKDNTVYAFTDNQVAQGLTDDKVKMTKAEVELHLNPVPTDDELLKIKLAEKHKYLNDTDHKFFNRYKPRINEDLDLIEALRDSAREFIRNANEIR